MSKIITLLILALVLSACTARQPESLPATNVTADTALPNEEIEPELGWKKIDTGLIPRVPGVFDFSLNIPEGWAVEVVPAIEAINFYDPSLPGQLNLDKSQIFLRYFRASQFLTLPTVTIYNQTETTINERPAVVYEIEKKPAVADFFSQPAWRNDRHSVTDIRSTDSNPTVFYVFGQRPGLEPAVIDTVLNSVAFYTNRKSNAISPIDNFTQRITKKPFGIFITPDNSPVQPERFSGYHTAVDVEYDDVASDVAVFAVADGTVVRSGKASGYGGVIAMRHSIDGLDYLAIYGHLDPNSLVSNGAQVTRGQQIGILGEGYTSETGGERKHLHFGLYIGNDVNIRGYVQTEDELDEWVNPLTILNY